MTNDKDSAVRQANREWEVSDFDDDGQMADWAREWGVDLLEAALRQPTQSDALKAAGAAIRGLLDITSEYNLDSEQAGRAYAALHDIGTALQEQSK